MHTFDSGSGHAIAGLQFFFTPSYRNDLDRLLLMRRSIRRFYKGQARHLIAVPEEDLPLFQRSLEHDDCELLTQQSLIKPAFFPYTGYRTFARFFPAQAWRLGRYAGKGGWIIQQIVKLKSSQLIDAGPIGILDSDLFFVRPFDDRDLIPPRGKILMRQTPTTESGKHRKHIANARQLLGLIPGDTEHHFMSCPAIIYAEWVQALLRHIESIHGRGWQDVLHAQSSISEYSLYGVFVDEILKPNDIVIREQSFSHMLWDSASFEDFFSDVHGAIARAPEKICVVAQSALQIPPAEYVHRLRTLLEE